MRIVDVFVDELDLVKLGFEGAIPADSGRPAYHPAILLKICIYGYLNRIQSATVDTQHHLIVARQVTNVESDADGHFNNDAFIL